MKTEHTITTALTSLAAVFVMGLLPIRIQAQACMDLEKEPENRER